MGLDISSLSDKDYHYSYSGIHYIRYMAHRSIGGKLDYGTWHAQQADPNLPKEYEEARNRFPNLYWHSDCDGKYSIRGKVESFDNPGKLQTGNSKGLLKELQFIKDNLKNSGQNDGKIITERDWYVFNMLYDLVKDVVENHDGKLEFC